MCSPSCASSGPTACSRAWRSRRRAARVGDFGASPEPVGARRRARRLHPRRSRRHRAVALRLPGQARAARQLEPELRLLRGDRGRARRAASVAHRARRRARVRGHRRRRRATARCSTPSVSPRRPCCATAPTSTRSGAPAPRPRTSLDEDGRLVEAMVVGADQVPTLARDLAGVDPAPYGTRRDVSRPVRRGARPVPPRARSRCAAPVAAPARRTAPTGRARGRTRSPTTTSACATTRTRPPTCSTVCSPAHVSTTGGVPDNYSVALGGTPTTKGAGDVARR